MYKGTLGGSWGDFSTLPPRVVALSESCVGIYIHNEIPNAGLAKKLFVSSNQSLSACQSKYRVFFFTGTPPKKLNGKPWAR